MSATGLPRSFALAPGRLIGGKYVVEYKLGAGYEGEVYKIIERTTDASRTAKLFYPHRNEQDRAIRFYAKKLERLRNCPIVVDYHHSETVRIRGAAVTAMISEYVDGELLDAFVRRQPGRRLHPFEAMHLLRALAAGLAQIHELGEYHGDVHSENILVSRRGIHFDIKLVDFYNHTGGVRQNQRDDLVDLIRVFYDAVGGAPRYRTLPPEVKTICAGLKRSIILRRFPTARRLLEHLDGMDAA